MTPYLPKPMSDREKLVWWIIIAAVLLIVIASLASCTTPRQNEALSVLSQMLADGVISQAQFDALVTAMSPTTWVSDLIEMGSSILGGGGLGYVITNNRRNAARKKRGEPVAAPIKVN